MAQNALPAQTSAILHVHFILRLLFDQIPQVLYFWCPHGGGLSLHGARYSSAPELPFIVLQSFS